MKILSECGTKQILQDEKQHSTSIIARYRIYRGTKLRLNKESGILAFF